MRARVRRPRSRLPWVVAAGVLLALGVFGGIQAVRAALLGRDGRAALIRAEQHLSAQEVEQTRAELTAAHQSFTRMGEQLDRMGPLWTAARFVPVLRSQVLAVNAMQKAGVDVSQAGERLSDAAQRVLDSTKENLPLSESLDRLKGVQAALGPGLTALRQAQENVAELDGRWLIGPIGSAQDELSRRLGKAVDQASSAESGMTALLDFVGANGHRRYLFLSQNPDEIRPTGGFIGMLGVFTADQGDLNLQQFESSSNFMLRHPEAYIPGAQAGSPFRHITPPYPQRIMNANSTPDWPRSAQLAAELWEGAGEPPVDGVVSFTPSFLGRMLSVLGPVTVAEYGETVTAENVIERFDFYTEREETGDDRPGEKKSFIAQLGQTVFGKLIDAPSSSWTSLASSIGQGMGAREGMVWSRHEGVASALAQRSWDGAFPATEGDFFYNGEFSYAAKNGRGLKRTFDHEVKVDADGSARITTTMRIHNTEDPGRYNPTSLSYITLYGPIGASLDPASDPPYSLEPEVAGHPAVGYFLGAPPGRFVTVRVVWEAKNVVRRAKEGSWQYSLTWLRVPDHTGDVLNLRVELPEGWSWKGDAPPSRVELTSDVQQSWAVKR